MSSAVLSKKDNVSNPLEAVDIIRVLSYDISLLLLDTIAVANWTSDLSISKLNLTQKQFYSRMTCIMDCGLIRRMSGKYILTSFGKIIYYVIMAIKKASEYHLKLKVIDLKP